MRDRREVVLQIDHATAGRFLEHHEDLLGPAFTVGGGINLEMVGRLLSALTTDEYLRRTFLCSFAWVEPETRSLKLLLWSENFRRVAPGAFAPTHVVFLNHAGKPHLCESIEFRDTDGAF